jgi:hypothetical protein
MEQDKDLADSCARVLGRLNMNASGSACDPSDAIQVFVNERRVGFLDGRDAEATFQFHRQGCVDHVHLRSEDGVLIGSLSAPECGFRAARIPLSRGTVELRIHNTAEGGSASAVFTPAPRRQRGLLATIAESVQAGVPYQASPVTARGIRMVIITQALLAVIVLGVAADRIATWVIPERTALPVARTEASSGIQQGDVVKLEQQLGDLARMQAKVSETVQLQQQGMAQLQQAVAKLSLSQSNIGVGMMAAKQKTEERQEGIGQDVMHASPTFMSKAQMDKERLEAEIHSLTAANTRLSKEMAGLVEQNHDLEKKLKAVRPEVAKAAVAHQESGLTARRSGKERPTSITPLAEARGHAHPFLFWVNFSEGATQESIDQWVHDMHGHKGAVNEGWQEVEIVQPTIPADRFLEQVKGAKIVKAVRVNR